MTPPDAEPRKRRLRKASTTDKTLLFVFAVTFCAVLAYAALRSEPISDPNKFFLLRMIAALSAAGLGATFPGFIYLESAVASVVIRAGGAAALFMLVYLVNPPSLGPSTFTTSILAVSRSGPVSEGTATLILKDYNRSQPLDAQGSTSFNDIPTSYLGDSAIVRVETPDYMTRNSIGARVALSRDRILIEMVPRDLRHQQPDFFDIESHTVLDLSGWVAVPPESRGRKIEKATRNVKTLTVKKSPAAREYVDGYGTSGLGIELRAVSHLYHVDELASPSVTGTNAVKEANIRIDVSGESVNTPFEITQEALFWNAFQGEKSEWASVVLEYPTNLMEFSIVFPQKKPCRGIHLYDFLYEEGAKPTPYAGDLDTLSTGRTFRWRVNAPQTNHVYRVVWDW